MVAHESAHGYVAFRNGDPTAYQLGRLTWNPVKHIDPFLTILLPVMMYLLTNGAVMFGGAKPIPVNPRNYRNFKRGDIAVSLAGVTTNVIIALLLIPVIVAIGLIGRAAPATSETLSVFQVMFRLGIFINLVLAAFNLIPIPPLDGSHVMKYLLPPAWGLGYQRIGRYGFLILILLLNFGRGLIQLWLTPVYLLAGAADRVIFPFIIPSQWTM